ncbi:MAG: hypothetical protein U0904_01420 [Candidatus Nanopelagicales bacterium]|nr:hypothetical protein [Candidatus Nanopelagicales bacterium]
MSAVSASPAAPESRVDSVRASQHGLYRAAKADPGRLFHALSDKIYRRDVLWRAWVDVRRAGRTKIGFPATPLSVVLPKEATGPHSVAGSYGRPRRRR